MYEERDELFCRVVLSFARAKVSFDAQLAEYRKSDSMSFARLDDFVEHTVYNLKEDCHFLFRQANHHQPNEQISGESLFDISVGSIFHELMKIKESVYQLEHYAPLYSAMETTADRSDARPYERAFLEACRKIIARARESLPSDLDSVEELFGDAADNLKITLAEHTTNRLLARMIVDEEELMKKCFAVDDVDALLAETYSGKLDEAHLAAARDYLEGGWYEKAHREARKVLDIAPANIEAAQIARKLSEKAAKTVTGEE
ncbi:MAG: hypothetical protein HQ592_11225 [Planctomycetes bacterium]|nr:hypothetical protein [Planctomycetota bacterium]